ncbi:MAG: hypothetical protein GY753_17560 [Gammaproteobacteria bacterium]|nr:hypothetical protein [Gammaproteobacteria bacterium]
MIISHRHKFIFFAVGKTGTHSIESVLKKYDDGFELSKEESAMYLEHIPPFFLRMKLSKEVWNSYYKFSFVRNTWDMVISDLFWNKLIPDNIEHITVHDVNNLYENQKQYRRGIIWRDTREQHSFLADKDGKLLIDHVGKFERIQDDFNEICEHIGLKVEHLPKLNARRHKPFRQYYTHETIEEVRRLWRRDIEKFEFKFSENSPP